jgi:hypothetical protein
MGTRNMKCINNVKDHIQVLYDLGILDDDEDWNLYCKMQAEELQIDTATWFKYRGDGRRVESLSTKFQLNDFSKDKSAERFAGK